MKKRLGLFFFGVVAMCFTSGCATMFDGTDQPVTFNSEPQGATVSVNGLTVGKTPAIIVIKRQKEPVVDFALEGYSKETIKLNTRMNGSVLWNIFWCMSCVFSTTTDYSSGAAYEYSPNNYYVMLVPAGITETPSDTKKRKVRSFILGNYSSIITELNSMSTDDDFDDDFNVSNLSEYLKTLFIMLEIPKPDKQPALDKIKTISSGTKDVMIFADEVINAFIQ